MTKEEFNAKMNRKNLGEIAEEQILAFCSSDCTVRDLLFGGVDEQIISQEDISLIRGVLSTALKTLAEEAKRKDPITPTPVKTVIQLKYILHEASDAMNAAFMRMLHEMRIGYDYSGLWLIYDACTVDQPFEIYQRLGDMIFNDHFSELDLEDRFAISPLFRFYYHQFDGYYADLIQAAESAWDTYLYSNHQSDDDSVGIEFTYEFLQNLVATNADSDIDLPSIDEIRKNMMQASAYLMALSAAAEEYCAELKRELGHDDDGDMDYVHDLLSVVPDFSAEDYRSWYERFVAGEEGKNHEGASESK